MLAVKIGLQRQTCKVAATAAGKERKENDKKMDVTVASANENNGRGLPCKRARSSQSVETAFGKPGKTAVLL